MININKLLSNNEIVIYRLDKKKWYIPAIIIMFPFMLFFGLLSIAPCFRSLFMGGISFESYSTYFDSIVSLIIFIPSAFLLLISYSFNHIVITNKRIFIRKGISGKLIILNFHDIAAFQHKCISNKGIDSHFIHLYLKSGTRIHSGHLYIKEFSLMELLVILDEKIKNQITSRKQFNEFKNRYGNGLCEILVKRNFIFPVISLAPFLIALIMFGLYIAGFNELGVQHDIQVFGLVKEKHIDYNKNNKISGYEIIVSEFETNKKYTIPVNEKAFNLFEENEEIFIMAKKGSLGLVYDVKSKLSKNENSQEAKLAECEKKIAEAQTKDEGNLQTYNTTDTSVAAANTSSNSTSQSVNVLTNIKEKDVPEFINYISGTWTRPYDPGMYDCSGIITFTKVDDSHVNCVDDGSSQNQNIQNATITKLTSLANCYYFECNGGGGGIYNQEGDLLDYYLIDRYAITLIDENTISIKTTVYAYRSDGAEYYVGGTNFTYTRE